MPYPIISIDQIKREATAAAVKYSDVNDACPYPFATEAGQVFKSAFKEAREAILSKTIPA